MQIDLTPFRRARGQVRTAEQRFVLAAGPTPLGDSVQLAEPAEVRVALHGGSREVEVDVAAALHLVCPCDRCLDAVACTLTLEYGERWRIDPSAAAAEQDDAGDEGDVPLLPQAGVEADLDDGFWQNAGLALPAKVLCTKSCRGLCPHCGANRNRTACECRETPEAGSMAVLAQWRPRP